MLVNWRSLNGMHRRKAQCKKGNDRKQQILEAEGEWAVTYMAFSAYGRPLEMVISFQYMGWVISEAYNNWPTVVSNLSQARAVWKRMKIIIIREVAEPWDPPH